MITIYNPFTKNKWFDIEWTEGIFCIFNYFTQQYTVELIYRNEYK